MSAETVETVAGVEAEVVLPLPTTNEEKARYIAYEADDAISELILQHATERLRAQHSGSIALDQRCTNVAAFQMTAVAITLAYLGSDTATVVGKALAAAACCLFFLGAASAFFGVLSGPLNLPGLPPAYWYRTDNFKIDAARSWAVGDMQRCIDANERRNELRGDALNGSLFFALAGLALVFIAGSTQVFASPN